MSTKKECFVISPIGEDGSEVRKRADQLLRHVIGPAINACGYEAVRADRISEPGMITSQVIQHIVNDPLVLADLTGMNPNVFYELAIRHAIRKPLVQIIQKGEKIPFDVAGMRTISVDHRDLDSVEEAKTEIGKQIMAVDGKKPDQVESPISVSIEIQTLRESDRPADRSLAEVVSTLVQLRSELAIMDKKISEPHTLLPIPYVREALRSIIPGTERRTVLQYQFASEMRQISVELRHLVTKQAAEEKDLKRKNDNLSLLHRLDERMDRFEKFWMEIEKAS